MKIVLIIPARLNSNRLKNKATIPILSLPMIEHVRRRAIISKTFKSIYIATPDKKIINLIKKYDGKIIITKKKHRSGTSRVGEAIKKISCSHVVVLFADEPLIEPEILKKFVMKIKKDKVSDIWNATTKIKISEELRNRSIVKCLVDKKNKILNLKRYINKKLEKQKSHKILKSVGIFCFKRKILLKLLNLKSSKSEKKEKIEQIKFIENNLLLSSVEVKTNFLSINNKKELNTCLHLFKRNYYQKRIYRKTVELIK